MLLDLGDSFQRETYYLGRDEDWELQAVMKRFLKSGDTLVDVGANVGMMTLLGRSLVGREGIVLAFEPNPHVRAHLQMHLMMNNLQNVNVYPFGLSCERSMCKLTVPKQHSGGGTLRPVAAEGMRTFDVETALLDDYADQIPSGRTTLVKIDTEGYDFRVLKGARDVLSRQQIIVISEVNHKWLDELGESPEEMFAYMNDLGYEPYYPYFYWTRFRRRLGLRPITLPGPHHWFNVVFVRQREYDMIFGEIATHWSMF